MYACTGVRTCTSMYVYRCKMYMYKNTVTRTTSHYIDSCVITKLYNYLRKTNAGVGHPASSTVRSSVNRLEGTETIGDSGRKPCLDPTPRHSWHCSQNMENYECPRFNPTPSIHQAPTTKLPWSRALPLALEQPWQRHAPIKECILFWPTTLGCPLAKTVHPWTTRTTIHWFEN